MNRCILLIVACSSLWLPSKIFAINFDTEIIPLLTKAGCNSGACHGAAAGRGGFHLSLWGTSPADDYEAIVYSFEGRRVNQVTAEASLIFAKPTGELDHGGGIPLPPESSGARKLLSWIREGTERPASSELVRCVVTPQRLVLSPTLPARVPLKVEAEFRDGTKLDVTSLTTFSSSDTAAVDIDADEVVTIRRPGQHTLIGRYMHQVLPIQFLVPFSNSPIVTNATSQNFIDDEVQSVLSEMRLPSSPMATESEWLRRVTLDLTGRLPSPIDAKMYADDRDPEKRRRLVDQLLSGQAFVDFWTLRYARWLNLHSLPNDHECVTSYAAWIRDVIERDVGIDVMARALLTATGDSHVVGPANFGRMVPDARKHAELAGRFFLGVRLGCANCHNHPLDRWTQDDYHGFAAIFARLERGRDVRFVPRGNVTNLRTNEPAIPRIPGTRDLNDVLDPREDLSAWLADQANPYFAKAMVNRLWQSMFGRGLVEPFDDMRETNPATHPALLDRLADDFKTNGYRIRHTLRSIALSNTYARSSKLLPENASDDRFYARAFSKRLMPEVLADAITDVTSPAENQPSHQLSNRRAVQIIDPLEPSISLDILGRCSLPNGCDGSSEHDRGIATQLHLMNGELINQRLRDEHGFLQQSIRSGRSNQEIMVELYLRALSRPPTSDELERWLARMESQTDSRRGEVIEDFTWSLLMSHSFSENH